jgi:tRNA nucleotidyltransferase (CCA-adding enzyme)
MRVRPEVVVTTHMNADLDGFSAMLAALYLYPEAVPVLPDTCEAAVRRVLEHPYFRTRRFYTWRDVDTDAVHTVIVVDAGSPSRIGPVYEDLRHRSIRWVIYDTHPVEDLPGGVEVHTAPYGATTTVLVREIQARGLPVSSLEATLMALGIYEDTGFFTFVGTTPDDLEAVAFLLAQGADVRMIRDWMTVALQEEQVEVLAEIRQNLEVLPVPGVTVHFAAVRRQRYVADLALVVHRLMDEVPIEVLFVALETPRHVYVVGRSRSRRVDVGAILAELGGGGHAYAGSASISQKTAVEVKERLTREIERRLPAEPRVRDVMARPVRTVPAEATVAQATELLNRFRVNALPVEVDGRVVGLVTRQALDQARAMGLDERPVHEVMAGPPPIVRPEATLDEAAEALLRHRSRIVLVAEPDGPVQGLITRMDLLRARYDWLQLSAVRLARPTGPAMNYWRRVERLCPPSWVAYFREIGEIAEARGWRAYLVGGTVRDIVMDQVPQDIDIVVEGPAILLAQTWAERHGARVHPYEQFGTAVVIFPDGLRIDFATARTETYDYPGAPPRVEVGTLLRQDLYRRDFTINAMALALNPAERGQLIDPFGGLRDVHDGLIRVLHSVSFFEDPARLLRAVRFAARYGFRLSPETQHLFEKARDAGVLERLPGPRKGLELRYLLSEPAILEVFRQMTEARLWSHLHPRWNWRVTDLEEVRRAAEVFDWWRVTVGTEPPDAWTFWALVALQRLPHEDRPAVIRAFQWPQEVHRLVVEGRDLLRQFQQWYHRHPEATPGEVARHWREWPVELVLFLMAISDEPLRGYARRYLTEWRTLRPLLTGDDLRRMGFEPGPVFREILEGLWVAQVDGRVRDPEEARTWVTRYVSVGSSE